MYEKATDDLEEEIKKLAPGHLNRFFEENVEELIDGERPFYYYFKETVKGKRLTLKEVYITANVSEKYGEKIIQMTKHTTNRDLIIRFCIAGHFLLDEVNRALKLYGMAPLYVKDRRDACIISAIHNRIYDLIDIDELLNMQGLKALSFEIVD